MISSDGHVTARMEDYRPYLPSHHAGFDEFDSAQRFQVARTRYGPDKSGDFPYLTVYKIDHDVDETFAAIDGARKAGNLTPPPGPVAQTCALVWVPLGERAARSQDK
jgi:hypothetical protein